MEIFNKPFDALTTKELYAILELRARVYVVEQACAYNDMDWVDYESGHVFALEKERAVGCLRYYIKDDGTHIGRVVVEQGLRRTGLGRKMMLKAHEYLKEKKYPTPFRLKSQTRYREFYASLGYTEDLGTDFLEDDIPHVWMHFQV